MKVTLLTGSIEPEGDGVGDYTRHLAAEATRQGTCCRIVALADRRATAPEQAEENGVETLRLPKTLAWPDRFTAAHTFIETAPPDWVSLQFVPYSFHRHGVANTLVRALPRLMGDARLHVMFHEIWIQRTGSWRRGLVSAAQRRVVHRLGRTPAAVVHTSNDTYREQLRRHGVLAQTLPLFGNVPPASADASAWLRSLLMAEGCDALSSERDNWWLVVLFGTLHPIWPPEPLLAQLQAAAIAANKRLALISIGDLGAGERLWESVATAYRTRMPMLRLGHCSAQQVSELLNTADYGIATTPLPLIGKSGSAAAMFDHGLPVIVNREDCEWHGEPVRDERTRALIVRLGEGFSQRLQQSRRLSAAWRLEEITTQWLAALSAAATVAS